MTWSKRQNDKPAPPPRVEKRGQAQMMWVDASPGEAEIYAPPMDVFERDDTLIVELELPGVKREAIEVYTLGNTVTVFGLKQDVSAPAQAQAQVTYLRLERKLGRFFREFELPVPCDTRGVEARYDRGLLRLEFKKIPDRRGLRRKIEVK